MRLLDVSFRSVPDAFQLVGTIERGPTNEQSEITFEYPERYRPLVDQSADPFAVAMLLPTARAGEPLEIAPRFHHDFTSTCHGSSTSGTRGTLKSPKSP